MAVFTKECKICRGSKKAIKYENLIRWHGGASYDKNWDLGPPPKMIIVDCECIKGLTNGLDGDSI